MNITPASSLTAVPHLEFFGGKVLDKPSLVPLYVGSYWNTTSGKSDLRYLNSFATQIGKSGYFSVLKQYGVEKSTFGGSARIGAKDPVTITDAGVQKLVRSQIAAEGLPGRNEQTVYTVFLPPRTILNAPGGYSSREGLGGYHSSFELSDGTKAYYAVIVYADRGNGINFTSKARDNITIAASHEIAEAATDPDVNKDTLGWYDQNYGEVADIPIELGYAPSQVWGRIGRYALQKEWSNEDGTFEIQSAARRVQAR